VPSAGPMVRILFPPAGSHERTGKSFCREPMGSVDLAWARPLSIKFIPQLERAAGFAEDDRLWWRRAKCGQPPTGIERRSRRLGLKARDSAAASRFIDRDYYSRSSPAPMAARSTAASASRSIPSPCLRQPTTPTTVDPDPLPQGISTGGFEEALAALLGKDAGGPRQAEGGGAWPTRRKQSWP
jgi:hypothetical protein